MKKFLQILLTVLFTSAFLVGVVNAAFGNIDLWKIINGDLKPLKDTWNINTGGYASSTGGLFTQGNGHYGGDLTVDGNTTTTGNIYTYGDITINSMNGMGATYSSLTDWFNLSISAGRATGGEITEGGGTTVDVAAGTGFIRIADDDVSQVKFIDWTASSTIDVSTDSILYLGVDYNGGNPIIISTNNEADFDLDTNFPLGQVINQAGEIYALSNPWWVTDGLTNVIERFGSFGHLQRDAEVGGLIPGYSGVRYLTMSGGTIWGRLTEHNIANFTTVGDVDDFDMYYRDSSTTWAEQELFQWNNTQYNPITGVNAYTLQTIPNNQYSVIWIWVNASSQKPSLIFPHQYYPSSAGAEAEAIPTFPAQWYKGGIIIGRFIVKQGDDDPVQVQSIFETTFTATLAADHGNLAGLSDDDHPQYGQLADAETVTGLWDFGGGLTTARATTTDSLYVGGKFVSAYTGTSTYAGNLEVAGALNVVDIYITNEVMTNGVFTGYASTTAGLFTSGSGHYGGALEVNGSITVGDDIYFGTGAEILSTSGTSNLLMNSKAGSTYIRSVSGSIKLGDNNGADVDMVVGGGNVGIGTNSPANKLHVVTTSNGGIIIDTENASTQALTTFRDDGTTIYQLGKGTNNDFFLYDNAAARTSVTRLRVQNATGDLILQESDGNVGIGNTSPDNKLEVTKARTGDDDLLKISTTGTGVQGDTIGLQFEIPTIAGSLINGGEIKSVYENSAVAGTGLAFYSAAFNIPNEAMRIDYLQNVGIGDTTPSYKLDVNGTGRYTGNLTVDSNFYGGGGNIILNRMGSTNAISVGDGQTSNQYSYIEFIGDTTYSDYGLRVIRNNGGANTDSRIIHRGTGTLEINSVEAGDIEFKTTNTKRMGIDSSGNVDLLQNLELASGKKITQPTGFKMFLPVVESGDADSVLGTYGRWTTSMTTGTKTVELLIQMMPQNLMGGTVVLDSIKLVGRKTIDDNYVEDIQLYQNSVQYTVTFIRNWTGLTLGQGSTGAFESGEILTSDLNMGSDDDIGWHLRLKLNSGSATGDINIYGLRVEGHLE